MSDDMGSLYEDLQHECIELRADLARVTQEHDRSTTMHATAVKERDALAAKLERAEGLLRNAASWLRPDEHSPQELDALYASINAYFAAGENEPRT